jgi:hypothetical protein
MILLKVTPRQEIAVPHSYLSHSGRNEVHRILSKAAKQGQIISAEQRQTYTETIQKILKSAYRVA